MRLWVRPSYISVNQPCLRMRTIRTQCSSILRRWRGATSCAFIEFHLTATRTKWEYNSSMTNIGQRKQGTSLSGVWGNCKDRYSQRRVEQMYELVRGVTVWRKRADRSYVMVNKGLYMIRATRSKVEPILVWGVNCLAYASWVWCCVISRYPIPKEIWPQDYELPSLHALEVSQLSSKDRCPRHGYIPPFFDIPPYVDYYVSIFRIERLY